ncbi:MAG: PIN domain-containing protein [Chloroflexi bacterium]|nr:PIN domain-containing protein [Chloroflexota bacterium]
MAQQSVHVFLDVSVLVAASRSPTGGSAMALQVCQRQPYRAFVTELILLEARVNIAQKFTAKELARFYAQLAAASPEIGGPPSQELLARCAHIVAEKDAHVLAAAWACNAGYLLTLDRRHLLTTAVLAAGLPFMVATPGELLGAVVSKKGPWT